MPDVRMPDGTIIRNVPEGTTRAQLEARYRARAPKRDTRPSSHPIGFLEGITKVAGNALGYLEKAPGLLNKHGIGGIALGALTGDPSLSSNLKRQSRQALAKAPRKGSGGGRIAGEIVGSIPFGFGPGGVLAQGALQGGIVTDNQNDPVALARDVAIGAAANKGGQLIGKYGIAPVAERVGRLAPVRAVGAKAAKAIGRAPLPAPPRFSKADKTLIATTKEGPVFRKAPNLSPIRQNVADAIEYNRPYALADASPELQQLGGSVVRHSPTARALAIETLQSRSDDQGFRAIQDIADYLHPPSDVKRVGQGIRQAAQRKSDPLYEKAFEGGSIAPLESQLGDAFNESSRAVALARQELAAAQHALTVSRAGVSRAGDNVYLNAQALPTDRAAQAAMAAAERKVAQAEAGHSQVLEMLRRSQSDAANNAPGAVWSPRVQQFLDDPISRRGMARGMEIQRLEALAQGKPFDPTELSITGMDEAGNPIVSGVPNMRTLDAVKKGLDSVIDEYPKDFKGQPILDERGRAVAQVLKSFRGVVDEINPEYAAARGTYQQYIRPKEALERGYASTGKNVPARDLDNIISGYNPKELAQFRAGYATNLTDQVANASDSADPYKLFSGGINRREKLGMVFPEGAPRINRIRELESQMTGTRNEILGGSPTQPRAVADQQFRSGLGDIAEDLAQDMVSTGVPGPITLAKVGAKTMLRDKGALGLFGAQQKAEQLGPLMFDTSNPQSILALIDDLTRRQAEERARKEAYQRGAGLLGLPLPGLVLGNTP